MTATALSAAAVSEAEVRGVLDQIKDPCSVAACVPMGLSEMGLIKTVRIDPDGSVAIELRLTSPFCEMIAFMKNEAIAKVGALRGVTGVTVRHDSGFDWDHDMIAPEAQARRQARLNMLRALPPARRSAPAC
jgi:metal-sulfur cluster biosynthetic enzyme